MFLYRERRALVGCLVIVLGTTLVAAALMHLVERHVQPDKLGTIPDALWWAIVTIGTIGYGDVVPVTVLGNLIATATIFAGLIMIALPVGIVATAFAEQIHRRDFIVTWGMSRGCRYSPSSTPPRSLTSCELLRAQFAEAGEVIVRRGDARPFDVFYRCRRGRDRAGQERAAAPRRRAFLRRGGGAAPLAAFGNRDRADPDQPAGP